MCIRDSLLPESQNRDRFTQNIVHNLYFFFQFLWSERSIPSDRFGTTPCLHFRQFIQRNSIPDKNQCPYMELYRRQSAICVFQRFFERCPGVSDRSVFAEENIFPVLSSLGYQDSSHRLRRRNHISVSFLSQKAGLCLSENRSDSSANAEHRHFPIL